MQPARELFVPSGSTALHVLRWRHPGAPLLFLTGFGSVASTFDGLARHLPEFDRLALTRRGQAPSDRPAAGYDLATLTTDIERVLDTLKIERLHIIAHSLGCLEMTEFARRHPKRICSVVYLDGATNPALVWTMMQDDPISGEQREDPVSAQIDRWWAHYTPDYAPIDAPCLAIYAIEHRHPGVPPDAPAPLRERADRYWQNRVIPLIYEMAATFRKQVPTARIVMMRDASHFLYVDRERDVVDLLRAFYRSQGRDTLVAAVDE